MEEEELEVRMQGAASSEWLGQRRIAADKHAVVVTKLIKYLNEWETKETRAEVLKCK